jgi:hypothetical protein
MVQTQYRVEAKFTKDSLHGDGSTEIRIKLVENLEEAPPVNDD